MPLPTPILDDRSYQQLRDELVRRIPVYAPEWTDHNPSDPGIALVELFAFLGENLLFRFNQIPETTKLQFLRLLDVPLRPASAAQGMVAFSTKQPTGVLVEQETTVRAGNVPFETRTETRAWPVSFQAVGRIARGVPKAGEEDHFATRALQARRDLGIGDPREPPAYYAAQLLDPDPNAAEAEALDLSRAVDRMLWIAVLSEPGADLEALRGGIVNVGFVPDEVVLSMADVDACPGEGDIPRGPSVVWQASTPQTVADEPRYQAVSVVGDTTAGLSRPGVVRLRLPKEPADLGMFTLPDPDMAGTGDLPPELDEKLAPRILFWLRVFREDAGSFPRLLWVGANATEVRQTEKAAPEFLGTGTGDAHQHARLVHTPVIPRTVELEVEDADGWTRWTEVSDFAASKDGDRHYTLDPEAGLARFGDGIRGLPPQIGQRIRARSYRWGGGVEGNVAAKAISKLDVANAKVSNPLRTGGGGETEPIVTALERVPGELRRHDRAVTTSDFQELALATPGTTLGRAECLPRFHPRRPDDVAAGVVSVVVWPREDARHPNAPVPDRTTLRTVCRWLDARRLVTTELYVLPPAYRKVAVAVGIRTKPGFGVEAVRRWVELVIRQYLAPLPPFGPSGEGWPLGRRVHAPELEAAALQVEGVEYLEGLRVAESRDGTTFTERTPIVLDPYEVPELTEITVVEGEPLAPGTALTPPPLEPAPGSPPGTPPPAPVPIPAPLEEC
ncbi:MAG: putative baseplate assembly protein [Actinomycetota bacterium]|nr:putative baseplate assembly protein [Actinomycetota bacterium]